jgi:hypothetical protein
LEYIEKLLYGDNDAPFYSKILESIWLYLGMLEVTLILYYLSSYYNPMNILLLISKHDKLIIKTFIKSLEFTPEYSIEFEIRYIN